MKRFLFGALAFGCVTLFSMAALAQDATAVIDKAIKAHGGEEALGKVKAYTIAAKGTLSFMGNDSEISTTVTHKGFDHSRQEFEADFAGNKFKVLTVIAGDKGWNSMGDQGVNPIDASQLANAKRMGYINAVSITILPLKDKAFKATLAGEDKVGDKPVVGVKATGPDGKDFTLYFDKETGLLAKVTADGVLNFTGEEYKQDTLFKDYKEMGGIKKATKTEGLRDGEKLISQEISEFKVLEKVEDSTFAEPK